MELLTFPSQDEDLGIRGQLTLFQVEEEKQMNLFLFTEQP
jgi:hypothetical protein